jgi:hypothetical protein
MMKNIICEIDLEMIEYSKEKLGGKILPENKQCYGCKNILNNKKFDKKHTSKDGLQNFCKDCGKQKRLKIKQNNIKKILPEDYIKKCKKCKISKNKTEFYQNLYSTDKLGTICIECEKKRHTEWNSNNPEKKKIYRSKEYFKNYLNRRNNNPQVKFLIIYEIE